MDKRQKRRDILDRAERVVDAAERDGWTPKRNKKFDDLLSRAKELRQKITDQVRGLEMDDNERGNEGERYVAKDEGGNEIRGFAAGESMYERQKREQGWSDDFDYVGIGEFLVARDITGPRNEAEERALSAADVGLPKPIEASFVDTLRENSLVDRLGVTSFPMESKTLRVVKVDDSGDVGGAWRDEGSTFASTDPSLSTVELKARTRRGKLKIGQETFSDAVGLEAGLERSLQSMLVRGLNDALLVGDAGSTTVPTGIAQASTNTISRTFFGGSTSGATVASSAAQWGEVVRAREALLDREVNADNLRAVTSPKAMRLFASLKDANHQPIRRPAILQNLEITESVSSPTTLASTNGNLGAELTLGDFSGVAVGIRLDPQIRVVESSLADTWELTMIGAARWDVAFPRPDAIERLVKIST